MPRNTTRRYVTDFEFAIWAVKPGGSWTFNKDSSKPYMRPRFTHSIVAGGNSRLHPTQKSEALLNDIVKIHTNPGDLVFDPFMGSGTTAVSVIQNDRIFLGSEIDGEYFKSAKKRIYKTSIDVIKNKHMIRSPIYYLGDKYKLLPQIIEYFPKDIDTFYDVFGCGGTMVANVSAEKYCYNDIDKNLKNILFLIKNDTFECIEKKLTCLLVNII